MPQTGAGLVRYFDEFQDRISIEPEHVLLFCIGVIVLEVLLRFVF